jgi:DNA-directed RNA polymerase specialized sigma24 family protein
MTASALHPAGDIDAAVLERAKRGDQEAFAAVIKHYDPGLRALAYRLLGDADRMDDALQEAYVKAFRSLSSFRGESRLGTWLYRIVYNACLDELGRARHVVQLPLEEAAEPPDGRPDFAEAVADRSELAAALQGGPPSSWSTPRGSTTGARAGCSEYRRGRSRRVSTAPEPRFGARSGSRG